MPNATPPEHPAAPPRPPSARKLAAARANGAKARGCKTEAGKRASSRNALKHGLTSATVVIAGEDPREYEAMRAAYDDFWTPRNLIEAALLDEMVSAKWRQRRALAIEAATLELEIERQRPQLAGEFEALSNDVRTALAFDAKCTRGASLPSLLRHEGRLARHYLRALRTLLDLRSTPPPSEPAAAAESGPPEHPEAEPDPPAPAAAEPPATQNCQNDANPEIGHCAAPRFTLRTPPPPVAIAAASATAAAARSASPCT